jgi:hypothetical protein
VIVKATDEPAVGVPLTLIEAVGSGFEVTVMTVAAVLDAPKLS